MITQITTPDSLPSHAASLGFVPTMGALHAGHLALAERAKADNDMVVVSIFVNPLQFGPNEDLDRYPRQLEKDKALLEEIGVNILYTPSPKVMYPQGFKTTVSVAEMGSRFCGAARPGHFDGVTTVVAKLFNQVKAQRAYFGEKDYQQLCIIRQMARDLNIPTQVIGVPTVREADGLAMSSRNQYLSQEERQIAPMLQQSLQKAAQEMRSGAPVNEALEAAQTTLLKKGFAKVDYLALCRSDTLEPIDQLEPECRLLVAAHLGKTRLIDNIRIER